MRIGPGAIRAWPSSTATRSSRSCIRRNDVPGNPRDAISVTIDDRRRRQTNKEQTDVEIKPQAFLMPKMSELEKGKYGPVFPKTPACYGFTVIAKIKPGTADIFREYGARLAKALETDPYLLAPLKLHYLRWVLFDNDTRFMYQGIFDTDFDKYTEDAISLFSKSGVNTVFENLEGFPEDWKTNPEAFV